ncbi:calsyntenin-2-like [Oncorhynchus masou masou]|uniref:calsyntenin-2-like n=1 Tax=Oncorhynchus masou masou TaxID=90313 RepID=UPI0031832D4D
MNMQRISEVVLLVAGFALGLCACHTVKVNKHKPWIETSYHGVITENMDIVQLDPPLVALDKDAPVPYAGEICAFKIHGLEAPFEAVVLNGTSGEGQLRARGLVDCELQKEYTFIIQAHDCGAGPGATGGKKSHKAVVHIQVNDVNEFSPVFREAQYHVAVTEGKIYDNILQVEATDQDCSPQYSQICNYQITTSNSPFAIDRNGNIRNTEKLSFDKQQQYEVLVTAFDCGQKRSTESVAVHIYVKPVCKPGWQELWAVAMVTVVAVVTVVVAVVTVVVAVVAGHRASIYSQNLITARASSGSTDLLPAPSASTNWTASLVTDSERDSDLIFRFDGRQAAKIPDQVVPQNLTDQFTVATWMKHGPNPGLRAEKETLLCNSDKTEMNRHHYSLYVHNCRLVFLLRRDFIQVDTFRPAEFHWKLDQICDKEWHYYVINVEFPVVTLYMDGVTYDPYLVTDDWPIHPSQIDVQLTVGACWQGGEVTKPRFTQYFRGSLSGLTIRPGKIESQKVISCLQACKEGLDINSLESLGKGIKFHFNPAQSILVMEGEDLENMNAALRKVSYINSRQFPTPGIRRLHISTSVQCFGEDTCISIPDIDAVVMVLQPSEPRITIAGVDRLTRPAADLRGPAGLTLFQDLHIISTVTKGDTASHHTAGRPGVQEEIIHNLDYCDILVLGEELRPEQESLQLQRSTLLGKHLDATNSTSGISIYGVDSMSNYEQVIRQVHYHNWHPSQTPDRKFRLTCSELNGRYTSNEFTLEISVLHKSEAGEHVNHMVAQSQFMQVVPHLAMVHSLYPTHGPGVPSAATVVIVICIAALVVVVVLGIYRIHLTHQQEGRSSDTTKERELVWDDSALNITVNPMENFQEPQGAEEEASEVDEEDEEDDDITSAESNDSEEEEEVVPGALSVKQGSKRGQLDWDNSTLTC